ncbi:phage tail assembly protein [Brevibacillus aydinogluensis]|uniref:Phage tail assembly protein n=1 Tax=Brevibacillus aydinogluensis TaxID=927786 RepID=A0AA48RIR7_9BACL|nr:phage tail assembly protein [Brevibacillus aydinogluensis]CAJ1003877.1 Phage tail assembly protein [Brevibacillus aydinogluensis]
MENKNVQAENAETVATAAEITPEQSSVYRLSTPVQFDGQTITELDLRFEDLTGKDLILCAKQARRMDPHEIHPGRALSLSYQIAVAAKAAGVTPEFFDKLKADDFTVITQMAENFLLRRG